MLKDLRVSGRIRDVRWKVAREMPVVALYLMIVSTLSAAVHQQARVAKSPDKNCGAIFTRWKKQAVSLQDVRDECN